MMKYIKDNDLKWWINIEKENYEKKIIRKTNLFMYLNFKFAN